MKYISTVQAAEKWGIFSRRVVLLCKEGRFPEAVQIGSRWMIPEGTKKPADGRTKAAKTTQANKEPFFRYPAFEGRDCNSFHPPLSSEELQIKRAMEVFHACNYEEAAEICGDLPQTATTPCLRISALRLKCMTDFLCNRTKDFFQHFSLLKAALQEDFPRKKELSVAQHEVEASLGISRYFVTDFQVDFSYSYHESFLPHLASLCSLSLVYSENPLTEKELSCAEYLCASLAEKGCYLDLQSVHFNLSIVYAAANRKEKSEYHCKKGLELAQKYRLCYQPALLLYYYEEIFKRVLPQFPEDFVAWIRAKSQETHNRYLAFSKAASIHSIYNILLSRDFIYVYYAVQGFSNKQIADLLHTSPSNVSNRYRLIFEALDVNSKAELARYYLQSTGGSV